MKRDAIFLICLSSAFLFQPTAWASDKAPLKVCILSGCPTYNSEKSLPPFQDWLEKHYNVRCTRVIRRAVDDLPGLDQLDDCDVAFVFFKRMELKGGATVGPRRGWKRQTSKRARWQAAS